jgi:hypothetical protein
MKTIVLYLKFKKIYANLLFYHENLLFKIIFYKQIHFMLLQHY